MIMNQQQLLRSELLEFYAKKEDNVEGIQDLDAIKHDLNKVKHMNRVQNKRIREATVIAGQESSTSLSEPLQQANSSLETHFSKKQKTT